MPTRSRALALSAFFVALLAVGLSACGGGVPGDSVAKVDHQSIKRSTFDHWMRVVTITASGQQSQTTTTTPNVVVPDPPDYKRCVVDKRKTTPKPAKGQPEVTDAQLKTQCQQQYQQSRDQVLSFLIQTTWLDQEAQELGIKVTDKEVKKSLDDARKQAGLDGEDAWQKYLVGAGLTDADVLFQQRGSALARKITDKVTKGKDKVSEAQIRAYYDKNKQQFSQPERRDVRIVLAKTEAKANQAKAALDGGQSWDKVAKQYSTDASKNQGGLLSGVTQGQQEEALGKALFGAAKDKVSGPVKTQFGWYVFEVVKITKATQQSYEESRDVAKAQATQKAKDDALAAFVKDFEKRWVELTECRDGFAIAKICKNAPKASKGSSTVPPGAQTAPSQQAPAPTSTTAR